MLSNHLQNGIETAKLVWSRLPNAEEGERDDSELSNSTGGVGDIESLDYEIIENYAYREEQAQRGKYYTVYYLNLEILGPIEMSDDVDARRKMAKREKSLAGRPVSYHMNY